MDSDGCGSDAESFSKITTKGELWEYAVSGNNGDVEKGYTHITVILDRSGSMDSIRDDTIGGVNDFLEKQKMVPGEATLTLVQFDSGDPYEVVRVFMAIGDVPPLDRKTYVPRGGTPLLDAVDRGINDIDYSVGKLQAGERPETVVVAVVTDGQENSSEEFTKKQVEKMIKEKSVAGWEFIFFSADLAAIGEAVRLGFHQESALSYDKSAEGMACCMDMLSERVMDKRVNPKKR